MFVVIAHLRPKEGRATELKVALTALIPPTRAEAGCVDYDLLENLDGSGEFCFHEIWQSRQAWDDHMASAHIGTFLAVSDSLCSSLNISQYSAVQTAL